MIVLWALLACTAAPPQFPHPVEDLLTKMDTNRSGVLEIAELRGDAAQRVLSFVDRNRDGRLDQPELKRMMAHISSQRDLHGAGKGKGKGKHPPRGKAPRGKAGSPPGAPPDGGPQVPGLR